MTGVDAKFMNYNEYKKVIEGTTGFLVPGQEQWLFGQAVQRRNGEVLLEIGSYYGRSSLCLGFPLKNTDSVLFCVDKWEDGRCAVYKDWEKNILSNGLQNNVFPIQMHSHKALEGLKTPFADFIFIDGDHEYETVVKDIDNAYSLLKEGGMVAVHDVIDKFPGILKAWVEKRNLFKDRGRCTSIAYGYK